MKIALIAAALLLATSCDKDNNKTEFIKKESLVIETALLEEPKAGTPVRLNVYFKVISGCGQFDSFVTSKEMDTLVVKVMARYPKNALCTDDYPTRTAVFSHTFPGQGTYYVKFPGPNNMVYRDTIR